MRGSGKKMKRGIEIGNGERVSRVRVRVGRGERGTDGELFAC